MSGWLDLKRAAEYSCLSVRTLRKYLGHSRQPLPVRLVGGKWLLAKEDLDRWLASFPQAGADIDQLVDDVLHEVQGENHERKRQSPERRTRGSLRTVRRAADKLHPFPSGKDY